MLWELILSTVLKVFESKDIFHKIITNTTVAFVVTAWSREPAFLNIRGVCGDGMGPGGR